MNEDRELQEERRVTQHPKMWYIWITSFLLFAGFVDSEGPFNCRTTCPTRNVSPVCGTDLKTYPSRCHLQKEKCKGHKVRMIHRGRCTVVVRPHCTEARQRALLAIKKRELLPLGVFVPKCNPDGSFSQVQCQKASRICWCVDALGKELSGTRVRQKTPNCPTPSPRTTTKSPWKYKHVQNYKGCPKDVRKTFNAKVVNMLGKEFQAYMGRTSPTQRISGLSGRSGIGKVHILMWKFNQLDTNANYFLEWRELHELLRTTKKSIHPKKCSKTFVAYCDENTDNRISRNEWYACFGVKEIKKCIGEYLTAVKSSQNSPSSKHFLPRCQSDGSYFPTQCHSSIGYCWCADVDTGKPIPGTTKKTTSLDCGRYVTSRRGGSVSRKKGGRKECTGDILPTFIRQLLKLFRKEITETQLEDGALTGQLDDTMIRIQRRARSGNLGAWGAFLSDNQVLAWKFHQLDANKNRVITNAEYFIPTMRRMLGKIKRGRKCSRKLLSECDFDNNGGLSLVEWSYCLRVGYNRLMR